MTVPDLTALTLRRSPHTRIDGLQIEPATGRIFGLIGGQIQIWDHNGLFQSGTAVDDLVPLQPKHEPLRCWALPPKFSDDDWEFASESTWRNKTLERIPGWTHMTEMPPGFALYETARVEALIHHLKREAACGGVAAAKALIAWEAGNDRD